MDLSTIKARIQQREYKDFKHCFDDVNLMWTNAIKFNDGSSVVRGRSPAPRGPLWSSCSPRGIDEGDPRAWQIANDARSLGRVNNARSKDIRVPLLPCLL
jgi:hypothetical protein